MTKDAHSGMEKGTLDFGPGVIIYSQTLTLKMLGVALSAILQIKNSKLWTQGEIGHRFFF